MFFHRNAGLLPYKNKRVIYNLQTVQLGIMLSRDLASTAHCWLAAVGLANKPSASPPVRAERSENTIICYIPVRIRHGSHNALYWCSSATQSIVVCNILTEFYWEFKNDDLWDTLYL